MRRRDLKKGRNKDELESHYRKKSSNWRQIFTSKHEDIEVTYEDFSITSKEGRLRAFMQEDHVRLYGLDIVNRIESVGFKFSVKQVDELPDSDIDRSSLKFKSTNEVFVCQKV